MKKKLMLAMSGGVDSSAALALLTKKYEVIGGTLRLFGKNELCGKCSDRDIEDARAVAAKFGVQHHVFPLEAEFSQHVMQDFVQTYLGGGTPNPCIQCNKHIKFGALLDEALKLGCEYFATGHYARVEFDEKSGRYLLKKATINGRTNPKDQSYVLYNLTQEQLRHIVFPLGEMDKAQVREVALSHGLVNANKGDSQDICFIPDGDYAAFIERFTGSTPKAGSFTDADGRILGEHRGLIHYTIGQRKGLGLSFGKPMFVIGKDAQTNTVVLGDKEQLMERSFSVRDVNFIAFDELKAPLPCCAKTRYTGKEQPCVITPINDGRIRVEFTEPQPKTSSGQSAVFYDGDTVLGGGIIE